MTSTLSGVAFAPQIAAAANRYGLDPRLLAAVAAQETGGPGSVSGANVVGDGGHGHGLFQIDDRSHPFAATAAAMDPAQNADYAANLLSGLLRQYGGNVHQALSAYNTGSPTATGTTTDWGNGVPVGYADSVLRHYAQLGGDPGATTRDAQIANLADASASVNQLRSFAAAQPAGLSSPDTSQTSASLGASDAAFSLASLPPPSLPPPPTTNQQQAQSEQPLGEDLGPDLGGDDDASPSSPT